MCRALSSSLFEAFIHGRRTVGSKQWRRRRTGKMQMGDYGFVSIIRDPDGNMIGLRSRN